MRSLVEIKTTNTYRATYLIIAGGKVTKIGKRSVAKNKRDKLGYKVTWVIHLAEVPRNAIEAWSRGSAKVSARRFEATRKRLKRAIRREIG